MGKQTQIDKAIENLKAQRQVLDLAIQKLEEQKRSQDTRTRKGRSDRVVEGFPA